MVRKEMLMVSLMAGGYPIDGKPKEHHNLPSGKQIVGFVVALIIVAAIAIFAGQTPVKTTDPLEVKIGGMMGDGKVQTNTVVDAATGAVTIPEGTHQVGYNSMFPINELPKNFYIASRKMLYTNVKISSTEVSGTYTIIGSPGEMRQLGGAGGFDLYFYKNGEKITNFVVNPKINYEAGTGTFAVKRQPESLGADAVAIGQP